MKVGYIDEGAQAAEDARADREVHPDVDTPTQVDEALLRREYVEARVATFRRCADWIEKFAVELCAIGVRERAPFGSNVLTLYHVDYHGLTFVAHGERQTDLFVDALAFAQKAAHSIRVDADSVSQVLIRARIGDFNDSLCFIFDKNAINQRAVEGAEGKVK